MPNALWLLRDPSGRVVGASIRNARMAAKDAFLGVHISDITESALHCAISSHPTATHYTVDGYTLERQEMDG